MGRGAVGFALALVGLALASPRKAFADGPSAEIKAQCVARSESAQEQRKTGHLVEARGLLVECSSERCPSVVRRDCAEWLAEVERATPTIVAAVTVGTYDVSAAELSVDGHVVASRVGAAGIDIDPGEHLVEVRIADGRQQSQRVIVREGEKSRRVAFAFPEPNDQDARGAPRPRTSDDAPTKTTRPVPIMTWVLAGVGTGALVGGAVLATVAGSEYDDLERSCAPRCSDAEVDSVAWKITTGRVLAVVGVASLVGAVVLWVTRPERSSGRVGAVPWRRGAGLTLSF